MTATPFTLHHASMAVDRVFKTVSDLFLGKILSRFTCSGRSRSGRHALLRATRASPWWRHSGVADAWTPQ